MAVIRALEDSNFRIVVVRIDTCDLPLRFKPFLYVDTPKAPRDAIPRLQEFLRRRRLGQGPGTILCNCLACFGPVEPLNFAVFQAFSRIRKNRRPGNRAVSQRGTPYVADFMEHETLNKYHSVSSPLCQPRG